MKFPKTAEDIEMEILRSSDKEGDLRIRQLISILHNVDTELIVEGIIRVFENETRPTMHYRDQEFAAWVLAEINPKTQKDLKEILKRAIKNWHKSIEQFPFWLRNNYGTEKIAETITRTTFSEFEKEQINTLKWWLQIKD